MDGDQAFADTAEAVWPPTDAGVDTWHSYHLIGDVLRAGSAAAFVCSDTACSSAGAQTFARAVVIQGAALQVTDTLPVERVAVAPVGMAVIKPVAKAVPAPAANDAVFRWKLVAGFASVAAVAVVAWSVTGVVGTPVNQGATLAAAPVGTQQIQTSAPVALFASAAPEPVWVSTPQGVVLRDPRMEELMRTHRQAGGGPVWQVPAGFLRAATHDVAPR